MGELVMRTIDGLVEAADRVGAHGLSDYGLSDCEIDLYTATQDALWNEWRKVPANDNEYRERTAEMIRKAEARGLTANNPDTDA